MSCLDTAGMRYETMSLLQARQLCADLIQHNFAESGLKGFPLVLNDAVYEALDAVGLSFSLVAFDGERPVGLCSVFISVHPQTTGLFATNDTIFCMQVYRSRGVGGRLIVLAEREAKQRGCIAFQWQVPLRVTNQRRFAIEKQCNHAA